MTRTDPTASVSPISPPSEITELARRHPMLHVHAAYSDRFVDLVGEGFDVGVRLGYLADSNLVARRICAFRGKLVASPRYIAAHGPPQTPDDLLSHKALMQGTESWRFVHRGKTIVVRPRGRFKADNGAALLAAALAGLGVAGLPDFLIEAHIASGALIPLLDDYPPPEAGLYVVRPPGDFPPRKVRLLTDILIELLRLWQNLARVVTSACRPGRSASALSTLARCGPGRVSVSELSYIHRAEAVVPIGKPDPKATIEITALTSASGRYPGPLCHIGCFTTPIGCL